MNNNTSSTNSKTISITNALISQVGFVMNLTDGKVQENAQLMELLRTVANDKMANSSAIVPMAKVVVGAYMAELKEAKRLEQLEAEEANKYWESKAKGF